jgi:SAM-dependent methyltransferase
VALAKKKHRVTYFELPGPSEKFARRLFQKLGRDIPVLTDLTAIPPGAYDAVVCFDVLEHVPDPPAVVRSLASYLKAGGLLYVSAPFYMILPWYPTHLRANRQYAGSLKLFRDAGLTLVAGRFTWYPLVFRKTITAVDADAVRTAAESSVGGGPLGARLSASIQALGRFFAWPFVLIHVWRWAGNRRM